MTDRRMPRALLVEDDPVSAAFLQAALERVPVEVDLARDCARARMLAAQATHALWVVDAHLPDGRGDALLRELREQGLHTPAIAHTATRDAEAHERLLTAGFREVLVKPLSTAEVVAAVRLALDLGGALPSAPTASPGRPLWDDEMALQALLGDRSHLVALRSLFRAELEQVHATLAAATEAGDEATLKSTLHRLRASCGFVGAVRLGDAAAAFAATLDCGPGWQAFEAVLRATADAFPAD